MAAPLAAVKASSVRGWTCAALGDLQALVEAGEFLPDAQLGPVVHELVEQRRPHRGGPAERVRIRAGRGVAAADGLDHGAGHERVRALGQQRLRVEELERREQVEQPVLFLVGVLMIVLVPGESSRSVASAVSPVAADCDVAQVHDGLIERLLVGQHPGQRDRVAHAGYGVAVEDAAQRHLNVQVVIDHQDPHRGSPIAHCRLPPDARPRPAPGRGENASEPAYPRRCSAITARLVAGSSSTPRASPARRRRPAARSAPGRAGLLLHPDSHLDPLRARLPRVGHQVHQAPPG